MELWRKNKTFSFTVLIFLTLIFQTFFSCRKAEKEVNISFSWWGKDFRHEYTKEGLKDFMKKNPLIKVEAIYGEWAGYEDAFDQAVKDEKNTDVMQINFDWLYKYSPDGQGFFDINKVSQEIDLYNFSLADLDFGMMNGCLNAIPVGFNTVIPVYDKSLLDSCGLSVPSDWESLIEAGKKLKERGFCLLGADSKHLFLLALAWFEQTHSKKMFSEEGRLAISKEEAEEIISFVSLLFKEGVLYSDPAHFVQSTLAEKKIAGAFVWCNETALFASEFDKKGGDGVLGNFISDKNALESGWYIKPVSMYAIKKNCSHPKEAARLINFLLNDADFALKQKCDKGVPVSNTSLTALMENQKLEKMQSYSLMKIRFNRAKINRMLPVLENKKVISIFTENCLDYYRGRKKLSFAAADFYEQISRLLD